MKADHLNHQQTPHWAVVIVIINVLLIGSVIIMNNIINGQYSAVAMAVGVLLLVVALLYGLYRLDVSLVWYVMAVGLTLLNVGYGALFYILTNLSTT